MESDYEARLRRDEEITRSQETRLRRKLLCEYVDIESGCTFEEIEAIPVPAETKGREAA